MKVLVTGGAGFIGSHLVDRLVAADHEVTVLDHLEPQVHPTRPDYLNPGARYVRKPVQDAPTLRRLLRENEVVYHLAAMVGVGQSMYQIERYVEANTLATARLLDALVNRENSVRKLVVAASMSSYGEGRYRCSVCGPVDPPLRPEAQLKRRRWEPVCPRCAGAIVPVPTDEDKPLQSNSIYAITKKDQEEMCLTVGRAYGLPVVSMRFFNVYGPRQALSNPYTGVAAIFSSRIKNGNPPVVYEDGAQTRDFIHVSDLVRALELAAKRKGADFRALNVGTGRPQTIAGVAETLLRLYGAERIRPEIRGNYRAGDVRHCYADTTRIEEALGWKAKTAFEDGMRELVAWSAGVKAVDRFAQAQKELQAHGLLQR